MELLKVGSKCLEGREVQHPTSDANISPWYAAIHLLACTFDDPWLLPHCVSRTPIETAQVWIANSSKTLDSQTKKG